MGLRCRLLGHADLIRRRDRDKQGNVVRPHVIVWECGRCGQLAGESEYAPRPRLMRSLRWNPLRFRLVGKKNTAA